MATTRRETREKRCPQCKVHHLNCFCDQIKPLHLKTRVSLLVFKKEVFLPSNTANLTLMSLSNSTQFERGYEGVLLGEDFIANEDYQPLYLFPTDDAIELTTEYLSNFDKPINLIVPDGTWRQAKKVHRREQLLKDVPRVKITPNKRSIYPLRRQKYEYGLCTHEAIAYALKIISGLNEFDTLMCHLKIFIDAHLKNRPIFEKEKPNPYL